MGRNAHSRGFGNLCCGDAGDSADAAESTTAVMVAPPISGIFTANDPSPCNCAIISFELSELTHLPVIIWYLISLVAP
jgi:hypothetical protein